MYRGSIYPVPNFNWAAENELNGIGYIAVHPDKGVFLGVDETQTPIFRQPSEIDSSQEIPVFFEPDKISFQATKDKSIFECTGYKVKGADMNSNTVSAADAIENGQIKITQDGNFADKFPVFNGRLERAFHKAAHLLLDPLGAGQRLYKPAQPTGPK